MTNLPTSTPNTAAPKKRLLGGVFAAPRPDDRMVVIRALPEQGFLTIKPGYRPATTDIFVGPTRKSGMEPTAATVTRSHVVITRAGITPVADRYWRLESGETRPYDPRRDKGSGKVKRLAGQEARLEINTDRTAPQWALDALAGLGREDHTITEGLLPLYWEIHPISEAAITALEGYAYGPYTRRVQGELTQMGMVPVPPGLLPKKEAVSGLITATTDIETLKAGTVAGWVPKEMIRGAQLHGWNIKLGDPKTSFGRARINIRV